ncbi:hypothetical protein PHSY_005937 [Pseudozyma hubeiensis SY62]|uniref:Uncharacterized protein n=1 Tax=Pseudozyma hubeiensis (strain SY62) TaxID=1305764 RepID=R9PAI9_PSEHS|nr:hypothetical protein PHSY_005937 [Pseudozyma hubeiensis SY62]GAC98344.1 hypothetical protein PHSY_005937 [Pseudozyma hubeiensis SY62]
MVVVNRTASDVEGGQAERPFVYNGDERRPSRLQSTEGHNSVSTDFGLGLALAWLRRDSERSFHEILAEKLSGICERDE